MLTLLIPTMNRADFVIRLIDYYARLDYQHYIFIGDSSNQQQAEQIKKAIADWSGKLKIKYFPCPEQDNYACFKHLLSAVETPYAAYCADDDFLVPQTMVKCVAFLAEHPDYIAAHGEGILISLKQNGPYGNIQSASSYRQPALESDSSAVRLSELLSKYGVIQFSVFQTAAWRFMYQSEDVPDRRFRDELLVCSLGAVYGKIKQIEGLYLIRQTHSQRYLLPGWFKWITSSDWLPSYNRFKEILAAELKNRESLNNDQADQFIDEAFINYLISALLGSNQRDRKNIIDKVRSNQLARKLWWKTMRLWPNFSKELSLPALLSPKHRCFADFSLVYKLINKGAA